MEVRATSKKVNSHAPISETSTEEEGRRMLKLRSALQITVREVLANCDFDKFGKCFPKILASTDPNLQPYLRDIHEKFVTSIEKSIFEDFAILCAEKKVCSKLNKLDSLIDEQQPLLYESNAMNNIQQQQQEEGNSTTIEMSMPTSPVDIVRSAIMERKKVEKARLENMLRQLEIENNTLRVSLTQQRERMNASVKTVTETLNTIRAVSKPCNEWSIPNAADLMQEMAV